MSHVWWDDEEEEEYSVHSVGSAAPSAWQGQEEEETYDETRTTKLPGGFHEESLLGQGDGIVHDDFALGSERRNWPPPRSNEPFAEGSFHHLWRQLALALLIFAGVWAAMVERRPSEESFRDLREKRYSRDGRREWSVQPQVGGWLRYLPMQKDRSFEGHVAWFQHVDHGPIAIATVCLSVAMETNNTKTAPASRKLYEHRYVGVLGTWVPLPYLPQPGSKQGVYGAGVCVLGQCACVPQVGKGKKKDSKSDKVKIGGCLRFQGGSSMALNVFAIPILLIYLLWQFPSNWSFLSSHATLSMANLSRGRLWVLITASLSHRSFGEIFQTAVLLASSLDCFFRADVTFHIFILTYLLGTWATWVARVGLCDVAWKGDTNAFYTQDWGAAGGLAAQLSFLARIRPDERFQFSLYMIPVPVSLNAWQSCLAHGLLDVCQTRRGVARQIAAHLASWSIGLALAGAWMKHV